MTRKTVRNASCRARWTLSSTASAPRSSGRALERRSHAMLYIGCRVQPVGAARAAFFFYWAKEQRQIAGRGPGTSASVGRLCRPDPCVSMPPAPARRRRGLEQVAYRGRRVHDLATRDIRNEWPDSEWPPGRKKLSVVPPIDSHHLREDQREPSLQGIARARRRRRRHSEPVGRGRAPRVELAGWPSEANAPAHEARREVQSGRGSRRNRRSADVGRGAPPSAPHDVMRSAVVSEAGLASGPPPPPTIRGAAPEPPRPRPAQSGKAAESWA